MISQFVESVCGELSANQRGRTSNGEEASPRPGTSDEKQVSNARNLADMLILEAEAFKASLVPPKGKANFSIEDRSSEPKFFQNVQNPEGRLLDDDEFFHIPCHVEQNVKAKIERGEFVELEKMLMHDRHRVREEQRLEFFNKDLQTYLAPSNRENRITNVQKWEQAFRVYAAIYSNANPQRAADLAICLCD